MTIQCNEISQTVNYLTVAFQDCNVVKNSDLRKLVELVAAVSTCANGGANYNTKITTSYSTPQVVTIPINTFHSFSLNVLSGSMLYQGFNFPAGSTRNVEYTTLNQTPLTFTVNPGSTIFLEYLIVTP